MTVSSTTTRVSYSGNGTTTAFAVPFYFLASGDLLVVLRSATGVETTQVLGTNYTVTGAGVSSGGTVTMTAAPAAGVTLVISRNAALTQTTDLLPNDRLPAESIETALDKLTMLSQQLDETTDRSIKFPVSDSTSISSQLPTSSNRANKYLKFTNTGAVTVGDLNASAVNVLDYGAVGDGVTDDSAAFNAAWQAIKLTGGSIVVPPRTYLLNAQWLCDIDTNAPHNYEITGYGATLKAGSAVTGWAIKVLGGYNNFGVKIEGLAFDHRNNTTVNGCIQGMGAANLRIIKCTVEAQLTKVGWAAVQLQNSTSGVADTGCFWALIDGLTTRARTGASMFVAQTTATTSLTNGSNVMTVAAVTGTIEVGQSVYDFAGSISGGQSLLYFGTIVTSQVSGTPGGAGVYTLSNNSTGTTTTDAVAFARYNSYGVRLLGSQNATKIVNCSFASVDNAVCLDVDGVGDPGHANGVRVERNDFEGVTNAVKVNCASPATYMPTGLICTSNRVESAYAYLNIGGNNTITPNAASFTGSITANTNVLTVTGCTGTIAAGSTISGAGVSNPSIIAAYGTGGTTGTGGNGTYQVSLAAPVTLTSVAMTVSGVPTLLNQSHPPVLGPDYQSVGSVTNYIINPNYQIVYGMHSSYYADSYSKMGGPSDYTIVAEGTGKNLVLTNLSNGSSWVGAHLVMGQYHYWTDGSGILRSKLGAPSSDLDGEPYFRGIELTSVADGAMLYYDQTTSLWRNVNNVKYNDTTGSFSAIGGPAYWGNGTTINGILSYDNNAVYVGSESNHAYRLLTNNSQKMSCETDGNVVIGTAALNTTATAGFMWIPSCAGAPTGAPTAPYTNAAALVVDTTNERLYVRVGSTWKYATLT